MVGFLKCLNIVSRVTADETEAQEVNTANKCQREPSSLLLLQFRSMITVAFHTWCCKTLRGDYLFTTLSVRRQQTP